MIDSKTEDLINRDIDRVLSTNEANRLQEYLATNPEAQSYYHELEELSRMLEQVEEIDPGPNLKKNILNSIPVRKYQNEETRERIPFFSAWNSRLNYRLTFVFALGLIVGKIFNFVCKKTVERCFPKFYNINTFNCFVKQNRLLSNFKNRIETCVSKYIPNVLIHICQFQTLPGFT